MCCLQSACDLKSKGRPARDALLTDISLTLSDRHYPTVSGGALRQRLRELLHSVGMFDIFHSGQFARHPIQRRFI